MEKYVTWSDHLDSTHNLIHRSSAQTEPGPHQRQVQKHREGVLVPGGGLDADCAT